MTLSTLRQSLVPLAAYALGATALAWVLSGFIEAGHTGLGIAVVTVITAALLFTGRWRRACAATELIDAAHRISEGDLRWPAASAEAGEWSAVVQAFNQMRAALDRRFREAEGRRQEMATVLASMIEGVVVIDNDDRIISLNPAAQKLFRVKQTDVVGRAVPSVIRNADLQRLVNRSGNTDEPVEGEVVLRDSGRTVLSVQGSVLRDSDGRRRGTIFVCHDITQLKRLETIRRDFVANVSHELRTPVTAIKGYAETLRDSASMAEESRDRFLSIISRNSERLEAIINDLLMLSRIEQEEDRRELKLVAGSLRPVIENAVQACELAAREKSIQLNIECDDSLRASINGPLLDQALVNLIQNAITYSEAGKSVHVEGAREDVHLIIRVRDEGCGIEAHYLPRIFERFYRVDKARSRSHGGTGLGLAIVKHIVNVHRGEVSVTSEVGVGSTFTIALPRVLEAAPAAVGN
ncbi:MAG: ATP-binding protein [Candidatus Hydrogenedentales bacterium]